MSEWTTIPKKQKNINGFKKYIECYEACNFQYWIVYLQYKLNMTL